MMIPWALWSTETPSPEDFGTVFSWFDGNAATFVRSGSVVYSSIAEPGTVGGSWGATSQRRPVSCLVDGLYAPQFSGTNASPTTGRSFVASTAASAWTNFCTTTGDVTLHIRFRAYHIGTTLMSLWRMGNPAAQLGCNVTVNSSGDVVVDFRGSTAASLTSVGTITANTWHTLQITKDAAGNIAASLDGGTPDGDTFTPHASNSPGHAPKIGCNETHADSFKGLIAEAVVHSAVLDASALAGMRSYFDSRWSATPDYSPMQDAANLCAWYRAGHRSIDTGVDVVYDESGYENHNTQTTDSLQPALTSSWRNGNDAVTSDGVDDRMLGDTGLGYTGTSPEATHYIVFQHPTQASGTRVIFDGAPSHTNRLQVVSGNWELSAGAASPALGAIVANTPIAARICFAGTSSRMRYVTPGGSVVSLTTGGVSPGTPTWRHTFWFTSNTGSSASQATIAEHIIFEPLSGGSHAGSETHASDEHSAYLEEKYDIQAA